MEVVAIIVEQLDEDGTLRTFRMVPQYNEKMWVAFLDEYAEPRSGPFHFLDDGHSHHFDRGFAAAQVRRVGPRRFYPIDDGFHFESSWHGIPTKRHSLTYFALSLPRFAIPKRIQVIDPHSGREYRKNVTRDDEKERFVMYLGCRSSRGIFDFALEIDFYMDEQGFPNAEYSDEHTDQFGRQIDEYNWFLDEQGKNRIQHFFAERITVGDNYNAGQAGAMGPNAQASNMTFQQIWNQTSGDIDLAQLAIELGSLRDAMREEGSEPDHDIAVGQVAAAQKAASEGDGPKALEYLKQAGQWTLGVAEKIGVGVAVAAMKSSLGY